MKEKKRHRVSQNHHRSSDLAQKKKDILKSATDKKNDMRMMCLYKKKVPFSKLQSYVCMNF